MGEQAIVERIISDAEEEAKEIIKQAEERAAQTVAEASRRAERNKRGAEAEIDEKVNAVLDGKAATARLDGAKIALGERRRVIDEIYSRALDGLNAMNKEDTLYLAARLLSAYAEDGDEIIFAENYRFAEAAAVLPVVKQKNLKISSKRAALDGGFILCGKTSDKNLSYGTLLTADREERQSEIAAGLFTV